MSKLSPQFLEEGRALLRAKDLPAFDDWMKRSGVAIDRAEVLRTFQRCIDGGDAGKMVRVFDGVFPVADPARDMRRALLRVAFALVVIAGSVYGFVLLVRLAL